MPPMDLPDDVPLDAVDDNEADAREGFAQDAAREEEPQTLTGEWPPGKVVQLVMQEPETEDRFGSVLALTSAGRIWHGLLDSHRLVSGWTEITPPPDCRVAGEE
jgi:hypothetical protein